MAVLHVYNPGRVVVVEAVRMFELFMVIVVPGIAFTRNVLEARVKSLFGFVIYFIFTYYYY